MILIAAKSTDTKNFSLAISQKEIGKLIYKKRFSFDAVVELSDSTTYQIDSKGFWGTTIEIKKEDIVLLSFEMNWKGNIVISTYFDGEREFIFKHKGTLKSRYVLLDKDENQLLVAQPDFKWSTFNYDYLIEAEKIFANNKHNDLLFFAIVHCANYYISMSTAAVGG